MAPKVGGGNPASPKSNAAASKATAAPKGPALGVPKAAASPKAAAMPGGGVAKSLAMKTVMPESSDESSSGSEWCGGNDGITIGMTEAITDDWDEKDVEMAPEGQAMELLRDVGFEVERMQSVMCCVAASLEGSNARANGTAQLSAQMLQCPGGHRVTKKVPRATSKKEFMTFVCHQCEQDKPNTKTYWLCEHECDGFFVCDRCYNSFVKASLAAPTIQKYDPAEDIILDCPGGLDDFDFTGLLDGLEGHLTKCILRQEEEKKREEEKGNLALLLQNRKRRKEAKLEAERKKDIARGTEKVPARDDAKDELAQLLQRRARRSMAIREARKRQDDKGGDDASFQF